MATSRSAARTYAGDYAAVFDAVCRAAPETGLKPAIADPATGVITLSSSLSLASWGENITIQVGQVQPGTIQVTIRSGLKFGLVDWGRNDKNLAALFARIDAAVAGSTPPLTPNAAAPAAGWHPDPAGRHAYRYWDGQTWTDQVSDAGQATTDPL